MEKRNIIAGLLLLSVSILIGPYMMRGLPQEEEQVAAMTELREAFADLAEKQQAIDADVGQAGDENKTMAAFASASRRAARAHVNYGFSQFRGGNLAMTHAHGNLQGMLNILAGLFLGHLALSRLARLALSWGLIAGSWIMVGALVVGNFWWPTALNAMLWGGTILIVSIYGLTLAVIFRGLQ